MESNLTQREAAFMDAIKYPDKINAMLAALIEVSDEPNELIVALQEYADLLRLASTQEAGRD